MHCTVLYAFCIIICNRRIGLKLQTHIHNSSFDVYIYKSEYSIYFITVTAQGAFRWHVHSETNSFQLHFFFKKHSQLFHSFLIAYRMDSPSVCKYCGKFYRFKSGLRQHELRHTGQGKYTCGEKIFNSKANLKRHE